MEDITLHPFSIASLTSPSRPSKPRTHLRLPNDLPKLSIPLPSTSPDLGTGSRECSPEKQLSIYTDMGRLGTPSPVGSVDSGHVSPTSGIVRTPSPLDVSIQQKSEPAQVKKATVVNDTDTDKPAHSYIALISMAIMASPERKLVLSDIYQFIMDTFPYYNNQERAWRNSIRHNLSLNECFIKAGRADNGKGNYWAVHPSCEGDFSKGDFRRRQARRRARTQAASPYGDRGVASTRSYAAYQPSVPSYVPMTSTTVNSFHPYLSAGLPYINPAAAMGMFSHGMAPIRPTQMAILPQTTTPASIPASTTPVSLSAINAGIPTTMYSTPYATPYYGQLSYQPY